MFTFTFSLLRVDIAWSPSAVAGILIVALGAQEDLVRAYSIIDSASSASTSTETDPLIMEQIVLTTVS